MDSREPRNPLYIVLLIIGVLFVATVLACALLPALDKQMLDAGTVPPPSPLRDALHRDGLKWVLAEMIMLVFVGLASMGVDRYRRWQRESDQAPPTKMDNDRGA